MVYRNTACVVAHYFLTSTALLWIPCPQVEGYILGRASIPTSDKVRLLGDEGDPNRWVSETRGPTSTRQGLVEGTMCFRLHRRPKQTVWD